MQDKQQIVFHIPKWYPNRYDTLLGVFVKRHILSTLPATLPVVLYVMATPNGKHWYEIEESSEEGLLTYRCYYRKKITGLGSIDKIIKLGLYFFLLFKLYRRAKKEAGKPCVVHAHILLRTAVAARLIEWFDRVPYVLLEHSSAFIREGGKPFNRFSAPLARYVVRKARSVITVSECLARGMKERYGLKNSSYRVIYNSVNTQVFQEKDMLPERKVKQLLYVGEFDNRVKNISGLMEAVADLYQKRKDFVLHVAGYGQDEELLKQIANRRGVLDVAVFFKGKLTAQQVADSIKDADALLMFSHFETLSCIVTESLCCGTPVISTAVGGVVEIVTPENGLLVPPADQQAMQAAIAKLLDGQLRFDKHRIAQRAQALFSSQAVGEQLVSVYKKVSVC